MSLLSLQKDRRPLIDQEIDSVLRALSTIDPGTEEYSKIVRNLESLYRAKGEVKPKPTLDPNTILQVAANLAGIVIVLKHEQLNVITGKAFGLVAKLRI